MKTLRRLRAKKSRKSYKSDEAYLRAVYRNNKTWIDANARYNPKVSMERSFVNSALEYVDQGYTATQAANKLASSAAFTSRYDRSKLNITKVIMEDKKLYAQFKARSGLRKKSDFDINKLSYSYDQEAYIYNVNDRYNVIIDVKDSPYRVNIFGYAVDEYSEYDIFGTLKY